MFVPGPKEPNQRAPRVDPLWAVARVEKGSRYVPPHIRNMAKQAKAHIRNMAKQAKAQDRQALVEPKEGMFAKGAVSQANMVSRISPRSEHFRPT